MAETRLESKLVADKIFDCRDLSNFVAAIVQVLPYRGASMSRFYTCDVSGIRFLTKLSFYRKTPREIYGKPSKNVLPHADAEINILKIFRTKITDRNLTPCILEMIYYKICDTPDTPSHTVCDRLLFAESNARDDLAQILCRQADLVKNKLARDRCAFLVLDRCDMSLDEYLRKTIDTPATIAIFKSLLFMIIFTIYTISKVYPKFHHYDLHTENIMLKFDQNFKFNPAAMKFLVFPVDGVSHYIPYFGIIPKIIDFGYSVLPEEGIISNVTEDLMTMYYRSQNDLLFLFHWIYITSLDKLGRVDKILQKIEPNRSYVHYHAEHIRKIEKKIPTYSQMINNNVWAEYRKAQPNAQIYHEFSPIKNKKST